MIKVYPHPTNGRPCELCPQCGASKYVDEPCPEASRHQLDAVPKFPEASAILQEAIRRYHRDPVLRAQAQQAARVMGEVMMPVLDTDIHPLLANSDATRDDWLITAAVTLVVAEQLGVGK